MKINFEQVLKNFDGQPMAPATEGPRKDQKPTLKMVAIDALLAAYQGEELTGDEKLHRYNLAKRINKNPGLVNLSTDDTKLVKDLIAKMWSTGTVGAAFSLIDTGK